MRHVHFETLVRLSREYAETAGELEKITSLEG